jgi:hypothetical protein
MVTTVLCIRRTWTGICRPDAAEGVKRGPGTTARVAEGEVDDAASSAEKGVVRASRGSGGGLYVWSSKHDARGAELRFLESWAWGSKTGGLGKRK